MKITIITLFPQMFQGPLTESLLAKARQKGILSVRFVNPRDYTPDAHRTVDDKPYGGGPGMVLKPEPVFGALTAAGVKKKAKQARQPRVVYLSPQGQPFCQKTAHRLACGKNLVLLCGHYEGIDERLMDWVHEEISIGDYVLTGGEIPAMVVVDAVARLIPGVVKQEQSLQQESFMNKMLDYPHYTRPARWRGKGVPKDLLTGNHHHIQQWRFQAARQNTLVKRPDLTRG